MKLFGLIGYPLGHSFSKKYFEDKFAKEQLKDCAFELFPFQQIEQYESLKAVHENLVGLAVTIPYKEAVIPYLSNITAEAKAIGAVNCVKFFGNKTMGYNTDVVGFEKSLLPLLEPHHTKALVLGTGGASKAVQYVLKKLGIDFLLVSRNKTHTSNTITYAEISAEILNEHTLIINTTPLGMTPNEDAMPDIPYEALTANHLLYDLIYKPEKTKFLQEGEKKGCVIKNGFEMLIIQAEENWKIWNENMER
jgi:shikimate dehydrogenase